MRLIALALLSLPIAAQAAPSLSIEGECPGLSTIEITGLTPGGNMTMLFSAGLGEGAIPAGGCGGTITGLDPVRWAMTMPDVDGDGNMRFSPFMPESACGKHVQIMDPTDCSLSGIVTIGEGGGGGDPITYEEAFTAGETPSFQCDNWNTFTDAIPADGISGVRISGTYDEAGIECNDPAVAQAVADALRTDSDVDLFCDGHQWTNCGSRYGGELWLDPPSLCSGSNCPDPGYLIRPCIGNANWGGVNTATCSSMPSQTMRLEFY